MRDKAPGQERPRRICFVLESAHMAFDHRPMIGGAEMQVRILAEELVARGHEVSIASSEGFEHARIRSLSCRRLWRSWRRQRPQVVVATIATRTSIKTAIVCRLLGLDCVYRLSNTGESEMQIDRDGGRDPLRQQIFYLTLKHLVTKIWCQHTVQQANLARRGLGDKTFVAANLSPDRRLPEEARQTVKRETVKRETVKRQTVLWIGRFDGVKRPELFPQIARRLPERRCVMIVPGAPPSFRESVADLENLRLIDYVPPEELPAHYARARVLVNTSRSEGLPNTFVEAACQGTPVVATAVDPGGFFARFHHGLVIGDLDPLARKIEQLFTEPDVHAELSRNARHYFEQAHEIDSNWAGLMSLLFPEPAET